MITRNRGWLIVLVGLASLSPAILLAQSMERPKSEEDLLMGSVHRGEGEPAVDVNLKESINIIVVMMAT